MRPQVIATRPPLDARAPAIRVGGVGSISPDAAPRTGGIASVRLDLGALADLVDREVATAAEAVRGAYDDHVPPFSRGARDSWPVKTGYSRSQFKLTYRSFGTLIEADLQNDAPYAGAIKIEGKNAAAKLLFSEAALLANLLVEEVGTRISRGFRG